MVGFNLAVAGSRLPSIPVVSSLFARIGNQQRKRVSRKLRRKFTQALLLVGEGKRPALFAHPLSRGEHRIMILSGIDLLSLVQGAPAERIIRLLSRFHAREALQQWIRDPNPRLRAKAAEGMGYIADSRGCLALSRSLDDSDEQVRFAAAVSLIRLGVAPPTEELMASFGSTNAARLWSMLDQLRAQPPASALRLGEAEIDEDMSATVLPFVAKVL